MNDRQLRHIVDGLGGKVQGVPREDGFEITVASEIMAVLCLSTVITDMKAQLGKMIVAYTYDGKPVTAHDLKAEGAMAALLKDALKPNLVQTLEGTPAFIHGGPFANIAHGCNSIIATKMALKLGDYAVTEAGFAADLGAEKFIDIKCRKAGLKPSAVVIVATVRALKYHGGVPKAGPEPGEPGGAGEGPAQPAAARGQREERVRPALRGGHQRLPHRHQGRAGPGGEEVQRAGRQRGSERGVGQGRRGRQGPGRRGGPPVRAGEPLPVRLRHWNCPSRRSWTPSCKKVYHGDGVVLTANAKKQVKQLTDLGFGNLPICMAKTQYSFSDDAGLLGAPKGFTVTVRNLKVSAGAGFLVALTGDIMTMPGLPKVPSAEKIDVDEDGRITGLF